MLREAHNELLNTRKIPIDQQCNGGYTLNYGKFKAKYLISYIHVHSVVYL